MLMKERPRRLRRTSALRRMCAETRVNPSSLILPFFVVPSKGIEKPIDSLPGHCHYSVDRLLPQIEKAHEAGIGGVLLFGLPDRKDEVGSSAWDEKGPVQIAVQQIQKHGFDLVVMTDVCLCEYTSHGHCGCLTQSGHVDNDRTLPLLAKVALSHLQAGADVVAPSDMMDGRVGYIRQAMEQEGFSDRCLFSYAIKYASACYGPFRQAADSAPQHGDRKGYQMDWHNSRVALREAELDEREGADGLIVKPGLPYLDILTQVRAQSHLPLISYWVSGEYAMIAAAAQRGWIDGARMTAESATCFFRAGADMLITYSAMELAQMWKKGMWR